MTATELIRHLNEAYGISKPFPDHLEVDAETYANVCQHVFDSHHYAAVDKTGKKSIEIQIGNNNGILVKGVELILRSSHDRLH